MLDLLVSLVIGALVGWVAGLIMKSKGGAVLNIVIGLVGSALGGWVAGLLGIGGAGTLSVVGILISIGCACLLIALYRIIFGKGKRR